MRLLSLHFRVCKSEYCIRVKILSECGWAVVTPVDFCNGSFGVWFGYLGCVKHCAIIWADLW